MNIGGLIKTSLIDYPGMVSCVVFTQGCNFHCPYCHNPDLVPMTRSRSEMIEANHVLSFLEKRKGLLDAVVVSGGEPTLQKGLADFLRKVKAMGFRVKLDTNGSRPQVLRVLVAENLLDYVAMDLKTAPSRYAPDLWDKDDPATLLSSISILMNASLDYEFRTTCLLPFTSPQAVDEMLSCIQGAKRFVLQSFKPGRTLDPAFFNHTTRALEEKELQEIKRRADSLVRECMIR